MKEETSKAEDDSEDDGEVEEGATGNDHSENQVSKYCFLESCGVLADICKQWTEKRK